MPQVLRWILDRCLAKDPADRYPDGKTLAEDCEDILAGGVPRHRAGWTPPRPPVLIPAMWVCTA